MADLINKSYLITNLKSTGVYDTCTYDLSKIPYDSVISTKMPEPNNLLFECPSCGNYFIARDPGFVPNCQNCGTVMKIAKTEQEK